MTLARLIGCGLLALGAVAHAAEFPGTVVLGRPTNKAIAANLLANTALSYYVEYGVQPGVYAVETPVGTLSANQPQELTIGPLQGNTRYFYRIRFRAPAAPSYDAGPESSFMTQRAPGSTFTFAVQGDSHPERVRIMFDSAFYSRTLATAAADNPDFFLTLGDDFSVDQINQANPAAITQPQVVERYTIQRPYLGIIGKSAPVFLVNGNHEQAARYLLNGTPNNVAVWAQNARNAYYPQPAPDDFYTGNSEVVPNIGLLRNHFAWTWGDALFVAIDPYWGSPVVVDNDFYGGPKTADQWAITHGDAQYRWLKATLEQSKARYKFVFAHHVMGTQRGGIDVAMKYEWGGQNNNGTPGFAQNRPTWALPIHQLMAANKVTIFFQGHDHIFVHQQLDGVTYQALGNPADPNYSLFNSDAYATGERFPNSGYARVTVAPEGVKVEYVRTYLPADEGPGKKNGSVEFAYTVAASGDASAVPTITRQPVPQTVAVGKPATFSVTAASSQTISYQWQRNGVALPGATASILTLPAVQAGDIGTYAVVVSSSAGSVLSSPATLALGTSRLVNISVRSNAGADSETLMAGFVVGPGDPLPVLLRGVGPTLANYSVPGVLADPVLTLATGDGATLATNDNWGQAGNANLIPGVALQAGAFALPTGSLDSAILRTLAPGSYGVQVSGKAAVTGVAMVEAYDTASAATTAHLVNVSARAKVGTGGSILIAGFVVQGTAAKQLLIRAVGPTLAGYGVGGVLADPLLTLFREGSATPLQQNDNWITANAGAIGLATAQVGGFSLPPSSLDAALLVTLEPGTYTAQVSGVGGTTGIALLEVYEVP